MKTGCAPVGAGKAPADSQSKVTTQGSVAIRVGTAKLSCPGHSLCSAQTHCPLFSNFHNTLGSHANTTPEPQPLIPVSVPVCKHGPTGTDRGSILVICSPLVAICYFNYLWLESFQLAGRGAGKALRRRWHVWNDKHSRKPETDWWTLQKIHIYKENPKTAPKMCENNLIN